MLSFVSSPTTAMPARNTSSTAAAGCQDRCQARHTCSKQIGEHFQAMFMIVAAMLMTSGIMLGQYLGAAMEAEEARTAGPTTTGLVLTLVLVQRSLSQVKRVD